MMKKNILGRTGIEVTELCFGALPMGPLQKNLSVDECTDLIVAALEGGVNFIDTAQLYRTYEPIRKALKKVKSRPVIATKSTAESYEDMQKAVDEALEAMEIDYIDIFHLHAARVDVDVFEKRKGAFECLLDNKKKGKIKAVGISTHSVPVTKLASEVEEIDVVFPIINMTGMGILRGTVDEMREAITACVNNQKGVYLMKVLAGGNLVNDYYKAMVYARAIPGYASIALGMLNKEEVDFNLRYFNAEDASRLSLPKTETTKKEFSVFEAVCINCGKCLKTCPNETIIVKNDKAFIQQDKCLQCGYCVSACPQFAIRMI